MVSTTAVFCFPPQWGWGTGDGNGAEGCFRSAIFGVDDWVPMTAVFGIPYELAFGVLVGDLPTPVSALTWGRIKSYYAW
jgi:hypothetical protein